VDLNDDNMKYILEEPAFDVSPQQAPPSPPRANSYSSSLTQSTPFASSSGM